MARVIFWNIPVKNNVCLYSFSHTKVKLQYFKIFRVNSIHSSKYIIMHICDLMGQKMSPVTNVSSPVGSLCHTPGPGFIPRFSYTSYFDTSSPSNW